MDGLSGVTSVGGEVHVSANPALPDLNGLSGLTSIAGRLSISGNPVLAQVDDLSGVTSVAEVLRATEEEGAVAQI